MYIFLLSIYHNTIQYILDNIPHRIFIYIILYNSIVLYKLKNIVPITSKKLIAKLIYELSVKRELPLQTMKHDNAHFVRDAQRWTKT